jgi:PAS domain S-box-containing protein
VLDTATFQGLLETAPDAIVAVDASGLIVFANAQAVALFGYRREELLEQRIEALVPDTVRLAHPALRLGYFEHPVSRPMGAGAELAGRRKDGRELPAEISLSAIQTSQGLLVSAAIRDVTDRKRTEAKFRGLLDAAPDAIIGVHADGQIALVNAQAQRLFGYDREELVGQPVELLVPERAHSVHPAYRAGYAIDPQPRPMGAGTQLAGRRKDGTEFPAEISLSALETEEGLLVSAAVRDVTERIEAQAERERLKAQAERKRLEAQLHRSQRLESLGQLAGGVAHDFNNLLAVILNYTAFISQEVAKAELVAGADWQAVRGDLDQVKRAAERAAELTHQLLAFGRREVVRPEPVNLNEVVAGVESLLRRTIGEHVQLALGLGPDLWPILADPGQLEQVLVNLAVNARDIMPGGGTLAIETENLTVDEAYAEARPLTNPGERHVRLRVSDTGTGMSQQTLDRAFEPFFTTKPAGEGSGLGLATVYGIITQAGGQTQLYSELGVGTSFTALLPAEAAHHPQRLSGGKTILVVEDEAAIRDVAARILRRNGNEVLVAWDGASALDLASKHDGEIQVLLTDVVMPKMLGKEVAERVHALRPGIRTLYMSGYAQPVLASQGTLEEGVSLLEKPFTEEALLGRIEEVLKAG